MKTPPSRVTAIAPKDDDFYPPVVTLNQAGQAPFLLVCDHASNRIPASYSGLGLGALALQTHIAWDPGALAVSQQLSRRLDAALIYATYSRLLIDPNRPIGADALIPLLSEDIAIPGNQTISDVERAHRIAAFHQPYQTAVDLEVSARLSRGQDCVLVAIHTFTPTYLGKPRPWPIGLLPAKDTRFSRALFSALQADDPDMNVGWNEPYAAAAGAYCTLEQHADPRGLPATLIELRNDELLSNADVGKWADKLARCLIAAHSA